MIGYPMQSTSDWLHIIKPYLEGGVLFMSFGAFAYGTYYLCKIWRMVAPRPTDYVLDVIKLDIAIQNLSEIDQSLIIELPQPAFILLLRTPLKDRYTPAQRNNLMTIFSQIKVKEKEYPGRRIKET